LSADSQQLQQLLHTELTTLQSLAAALAAEHAALLSADVVALETATAAKNTAIQAHRDQQSLRIDWMQKAQLAADTPLRELVRSAGDDSTSLQLQEQLASLAANCQDSNRRNGVLIVRLQERTRGALDVLRRDDSTAELYSLSGAREHHNDGRTLGKA
jgi:flagellar biosynthesis/type III secretory pathway chaperone